MQRAPVESDQVYVGRENLEVMKEATNYNQYLRDLICENASDDSFILDFGAGVGTFTDSLSIPASRISCVEPDVDAQACLIDLGYRTYGDLEQIEDDQFSYIFTLNVLEHIEDDDRILAALYRVLRPGGRLFIYVPAFEILYSAMDEKVGHFRRYKMKQLNGQVSNAGFSIEKSAYTDALGFLASLVYKFLFRKSDGVLDKSSIRFYDRYLFPMSRLLSAPLSRLLGKNLYIVARK